MLWFPVIFPRKLPINLQYTVGIADKKGRYKLVLVDGNDNEDPRLELYDEHYVMIWTSRKFFNDNKKEQNPHYKGYICPQYFDVPTLKEIKANYTRCY